MKTMPYLTRVIQEYDLLVRGLDHRRQFIDKGIAMTDLREMNCVACRGGELTVTESEIEMLQPQIPEWQVKDVDGIRRLECVFKFRNLVQALEFTNKIAALAEEESHHPLIMLEWWTHVVKGWHQNDFVMAAKTDEAFAG